MQLSEDDKPNPDRMKAMENIVSLVTALPTALLSTAQGAGVASILIGFTLKNNGIGEEVAPTTILKNTGRFAGNTSPEQRALWIKTFGSEEEACNFSPQFPRRDKIGASIRCETKEVEVAGSGKPKISIDAFPFKIDALNITEEFGVLTVGDILMLGGFFALSSEFFKGVGEIVPL